MPAFFRRSAKSGSIEGSRCHAFPLLSIERTGACPQPGPALFREKDFFSWHDAAFSPPRRHAGSSRQLQSSSCGVDARCCDERDDRPLPIDGVWFLFPSWSEWERRLPPPFSEEINSFALLQRFLWVLAKVFGPVSCSSSFLRKRPFCIAAVLFFRFPLNREVDRLNSAVFSKSPSFYLFPFSSFPPSSGEKGRDATSDHAWAPSFGRALSVFPPLFSFPRASFRERPALSPL